MNPKIGCWWVRTPGEEPAEIKSADDLDEVTAAIAERVITEEFVFPSREEARTWQGGAREP